MTCDIGEPTMKLSAFVYKLSYTTHWFCQLSGVINKLTYPTVCRSDIGTQELQCAILIMQICHARGYTQRYTHQFTGIKTTSINLVVSLHVKGSIDLHANSWIVLPSLVISSIWQIAMHKKKCGGTGVYCKLWLLSACSLLVTSYYLLSACRKVCGVQISLEKWWPRIALSCKKIEFQTNRQHSSSWTAAINAKALDRSSQLVALASIMCPNVWGRGYVPYKCIPFIKRILSFRLPL